MFVLGSVASHVKHTSSVTWAARLRSAHAELIEAGGMDSLKQEGFQSIDSWVKAGQRGDVWRQLPL